MRTLLRSMAFAAIAAISSVACVQAALADTATGYGHLVAYGDQFQVYVQADANNVVFSAILPTSWTYSIDVDADSDGKWGYGPAVQGNNSKPHDDYAYTAVGTSLCAQYIYSSIPSNTDMVASSSYCGERRSAAKYSVTAQPDDKKLAVYTIPVSEMRTKAGNLEFAVVIYDGTSFWYFGSPEAPVVLTIPSGT